MLNDDCGLVPIILGYGWGYEYRLRVNLEENTYGVILLREMSSQEEGCITL